MIAKIPGGAGRDGLRGPVPPRALQLYEELYEVSLVVVGPEAHTENGSIH